MDQHFQGNKTRFFFSPFFSTKYFWLLIEPQNAEVERNLWNYCQPITEPQICLIHMSRPLSKNILFFFNSVSDIANKVSL